MLSQKNKRNVFKKRKQLQSLPLSAVSVCCRFYFLYEIFVLYFPSIVASLFAKGWERPSVSGTHLSVTIVQVCLVSRVWPTPTTPPASPSWLTGCPPPAQQVPSSPSAHGTVPPSTHNFLGVRDYRARSGATLGSGAAFCHLAGGAMIQSLTDNVMTPAACGNLLCSLASW